MKDEWAATGSGGGSSVVVDAQTGGIVRLTTDVDLDDNWRIHWNDIRSLHVDQKVTMEVRAKLNSTALIEVNLQLRFDGSNRIIFNYSAAASANWRILTFDGGASTNQDSGIAADTDYHIFRIECFPTGEVHYYIDGVETDNSPLTTNIPDDAADFLQPYLQIFTRDDPGAKSMDIDYVVVRQEI